MIHNTVGCQNIDKGFTETTESTKLNVRDKPCDCGAETSETTGGYFTYRSLSTGYKHSDTSVNLQAHSDHSLFCLLAIIYKSHFALSPLIWAVLLKDNHWGILQALLMPNQQCQSHSSSKNNTDLIRVTTHQTM